MNDVERMAKEDTERSLKLMTEQEYYSLPYYGRWYLDWMARWKPKTCQRLKAQGQLVEWFDRKGNEISEILEDNYEALGMSGGMELVREMYLGEPEVD